MSSQKLPTRDQPLNFYVKEEKLTEHTACFSSGNQLGVPYLPLAIFIFILMLIISIMLVPALYSAFLDHEGHRDIPLIIFMAILGATVYTVAIRYLITRSILYQSIRFDTVTQEIELKNRFVRANDEWFETVVEKVPFSKIELIQYRVLNISEPAQACAEIRIFNRKPIQLTYKTDDAKAREIAKKLAHWISAVEKQEPLIKSKTQAETIETDIVAVILQNTKSLSFIPIISWLGLIGLPIFFTSGRVVTISELIFLGCASIFTLIFHRTIANTTIVLIYSIWFYPIYSQLLDDWVLPLLAFFIPFIMIPSYRAWLSYKQVKQAYPEDPRFSHWQNKIAQQYFPYTGLLLTAVALLSWLLASLTNFPISIVQEVAVHTAVFGFALGTASWFSGYPHKFASITASALGSITITLWLLNQFG